MIMERLDTVVSAVQDYTQHLSGSYLQLNGNAETAREEVQGMQSRVDHAHQTVSNQVCQAHSLLDEAAAKKSYYADLRDQAAEEVRQAEEEVQWVLDHPIEITETDSEGNTTTHYEVDHAALSAAQSKLNQAMAEYNYYTGKYYDAEAVCNDAENAVSRFEKMRSAIENISQHIAEQMRGVEQGGYDMRMEANYNLTCMRNVVERMQAYLNCKQIFRA